MLKTGEKEKWRNKGTNKQQQPDSGKYDTFAHCPRVYQVSIFYASQFPRKVWRKISMLKTGEKDKWRNKGTNKSSSLIPVHMILLPTVHVCTKFQSSMPHSSREKCDENYNVWKVNWTWRFRNVYWKFNSPLKAHNSEVTDPILPEFELVRAFVPVVITSKFDEDPIKNERASLEIPFSHCKSMENFSDAQGHLTL